MRFTDVGLGDRGELRSDINVTPLVAVLLVLVINMMLFVPPDPNGVGFRRPLAVHTVDKPDPRTHGQTVVSIAADRRTYLDSYPVREKELAAKVTEALSSKTDKTVLIEADEDAPYSAIMAAMDSLRAAGIGNIALIVEQRANHPGGAGAGR